MEEKRVALFLADFDHQRSEIEKIYDILDARYIAFTREEASSESVESSGYWLHNLYCAYEDLFKIVSAFWENCIENAGTFHKNLIRRMVLNIEGVRPALLSDRSFRHLDEKANVLGELNVFREKVASVLNGGQE
jgi:hypothetical protein